MFLTEADELHQCVAQSQRRIFVFILSQMGAPKSGDQFTVGRAIERGFGLFTKPRANRASDGSAPGFDAAIDCEEIIVNLIERRIQNTSFNALRRQPDMPE